jgi:Adenylate and Guanylate cyclase catalytic domain/Double zinc ribbon
MGATIVTWYNIDAAKNGRTCKEAVLLVSRVTSMRCSSCGSENPSGKKFCSECGTALPGGCPKCGADNALAAKFCGECSAPLNAAVTDPLLKTSSAQPRDSAGERRHLTVMFCDLVGSTEISARLDPEEFRELVADYHRATAEAITCFGGHVAKYLGDGVMAYFGWPEAHDNDAERAARAGLAILEGVAALNNRDATSDRPKLSVRVGIDTGNVVIGRVAAAIRKSSAILPTLPPECSPRPIRTR